MLHRITRLHLLLFAIWAYGGYNLINRAVFENGVSLKSPFEWTILVLTICAFIMISAFVIIKTIVEYDGISKLGDWLRRPIFQKKVEYLEIGKDQ